MLDKVYLVTCGEYSDYHVVEVFDNREMAEQYICIHQSKDSDKMHIEVRNMCRVSCSNELHVYHGVHFYLYEDGCIDIDEDVYDTSPIMTDIHMTRYGKPTYYSGVISIPSKFSLDNKDLVTKIIYDAVAKFKAEEAGI